MEKGYYKKSDYIHLWIHILLKANHAPKEFWFNGENIMVNRGQFITGRKKLNDETGISESKIERILNFLEKNEQQIEQQKTNRNRLISILNYGRYQLSEQQIEQPVNNQRTTSEQPVNTNNNYNNKNNENKERGFKKPTIPQIESYLREKTKDFETEAQKFYNFYESKNWMIGKNKMGCWESACSNWLIRKKELEAGNKKRPDYVW